MRVELLTREFPPDVYGGAGVHVDFLTRHLRSRVDLDVLCMGAEREGATAFAEHDPRFPDANQALQVLSTDLAMTARCAQADVVHSHTWYANMAGHLSKLLYDV
ncbi:MAG: glycosyltransferase, partial [Nocardioidaceae bacterium]